MAVMERYSITSLFVLDNGKQPLGVVHLHDLVKAGI
jgi:arabinose-5-phosphate isomerase